MKIRELLNTNPAVATVVVIVLLVGALGVVYVTTFRERAAPSPGEVYYADLETGEMFVAPAGPPPESPTGNEAARAQVFSCDSCDNPDSRFVGYVWLRVDGDDVLEDERMMYSADLNAWSPRGEARDLRNVRCEDGSRAERCEP